jgi:transcriptional regulator with XRE-family HTH domain
MQFKSEYIKNNFSIGEKLEQIRKKLKITQGLFAEKLNMSRSTLSRLESNKLTKIDNEIISILSNQYNVNLNWLLNDKGQMFQTNDAEMEISEKIIDTKTDTNQELILEKEKLRSQIKILQETLLMKKEK